MGWTNVCKSPKNKPFSVVDPDLFWSDPDAVALPDPDPEPDRTFLIYETLQLKQIIL